MQVSDDGQALWSWAHLRLRIMPNEQPPAQATSSTVNVEWSMREEDDNGLK